MKILILIVWGSAVLYSARFPRADEASTDARIAAAQKTVAANPENPEALDALAAAYLQKMRETTDFGYVERAEKLVKKVLSRKPDEPEALVLTNEIELNRHHFRQVVKNTEELVQQSPGDARLWGM